MKGRNNRSISSKARMEMLDENYNLFLTGMMTGSEFNKYVRIHFLESNSS
jgi:hypothetical protein